MSDRPKLPLHLLQADEFREAAHRAATSPDSLTANGVSNPHDFVLGAMWARLHLHPNVISQSEDAPEPAPERITAVQVMGDKALVLGYPRTNEDEETGHNCDAMGCPSAAAHTLYAVPLLTEYPTQQANDLERVALSMEERTLLMQSCIESERNADTVELALMYRSAWNKLADPAGARR